MQAPMMGCMGGGELAPMPVHAHIQLQPPPSPVPRPAAVPVRGNMVRGAAGSRLMGPWLGQYARVGGDPAPPVLSDDDVDDDDEQDHNLDDPGTPLALEGECQFKAGSLSGMTHTIVSD